MPNWESPIYTGKASLQSLCKRCCLIPKGDMNKPLGSLLNVAWLPFEKQLVISTAPQICALLSSLPETRRFSLNVCLHGSKIESIVMRSVSELFTIKKKLSSKFFDFPGNSVSMVCRFYSETLCLLESLSLGTMLLAHSSHRHKIFLYANARIYNSSQTILGDGIKCYTFFYCFKGVRFLAAILMLLIWKPGESISSQTLFLSMAFNHSTGLSGMPAYKILGCVFLNKNSEKIICIKKGLDENGLGGFSSFIYQTYFWDIFNESWLAMIRSRNKCPRISNG